MNTEAFIKKLKMSESYKKFKEEMDETSTTGMVAGYQTPKAFSASEEDFQQKNKENAEVLGYKVVPKMKRRQSISFDDLAKQESKKKRGNKMNEASTTLAVGQINIGESFVDYDPEDEDDDGQKPHPTMKSTIHQAGYTPIRNGKATSTGKMDSMYKQAMKSLYEGSYKQYKGDKTRTTSEKINHSIKELNQSLLQVERAVSHALRLKTEMAVDQRTLWRSSQNRLVKIGERLNRINKRINELGA